MARRPAVHNVVNSRKAPKPIGAYSQAIHVVKPGEMLFVSGQIPIEVPSGRVYTGDIKRQAQLALGHIKNIVEDAKFSLDEVVKVTIYLTDMSKFSEVDEAYRKLFVGANLPARAVVQVTALPKNVDIEIEALAIKQGTGEDDIFDDVDF